MPYVRLRSAQASDYTRLLPRHAANNLEAIDDYIMQLRDVVTNKINDFRHDVQSHYYTEVTQRDCYELLYEIINAADTAQHARDISELLIYREFIATHRRLDEWNPAIERLLENEVIIRLRGYDMNYALHSQYREAVEYLRSLRYVNDPNYVDENNPYLWLHNDAKLPVGFSRRA